MHKTLTFIIFLVFLSLLNAQPAPTDSLLPYREIPAYPDTFTAETVAARMIDGLGFRYYWATELLRPEDLAFRPTPESRSSEETIDHILSLSQVILYTMMQQPNVRSAEETSPLTFDIKRQQTLQNLKKCSDLLRNPSCQVSEHPLVFQNGDKKTELPFWHLLNGPIGDALWHVGQVVTFRRSSGNPFNGKVNVMMGKLRE